MHDELLLMAEPDPLLTEFGLFDWRALQDFYDHWHFNFGIGIN